MKGGRKEGGGDRSRKEILRREETQVLVFYLQQSPQEEQTGAGLHPGGATNTPPLAKRGNLVKTRKARGKLRGDVHGVINKNTA